MPYCTLADLQAAYGLEGVLTAQPLADPAQDPPKVNTAALDAAIDKATQEIDSYVMARYRLPLDDAKAALLKGRCVDMAMYHLAPTPGGEDEVKRRRYDDAVEWLKQLADGKVVLEPRPAAEIKSEPSRDFRIPPNYPAGRLNRYGCPRSRGYFS